MTTLQNFSNINQSQYFLRDTSLPAKVETNQPQENTLNKKPVQKEDNYFNTKTIVTGLLGLGVIGAGIWRLKSGKGVKSSTISDSPIKPTGSSNTSTAPIQSQKDIITERIAELRRTIQSDYAARKQKIIDEMNNFDEFDDKVPFYDEKDLFENVQARLAAYKTKEDKAVNIVANARNTIKQRIIELKDNSEWQELRKLRKNFVKLIEKSESEDEIRILKDKIIIINDLMINRVYPNEVQRYAELTGVEDKNAYKLLKKDFKTYEEFLKEYNASKTITSGEPLLEDAEIRFIDSNKLTLEKVFPQEMFAINTNRKSVTKLRKAYEAAERVYKKYKAKRKDLSLEFQQSENVKELKNLIKELKSIDNSSKVKEAA